MLGKVSLRRNDFLSFQTERNAKASIKVKELSYLYDFIVKALLILEAVY